MKIFISLFLALFVSGFLYASSGNENEIVRSIANKYPGLYTLDESTIEFKAIENCELKDDILLNSNVGVEELTSRSDNPLKDLDDALNAIDKIINTGKKIWAIIEAGRPVVNIKSDWASAVPDGTKHWSQLHSWKKPKVVNYGFSAKNLYGMNVIDLVFRVIYTYGGQLDGKGQFLTNVKLVPLKINVLWGYDLDVNVEVPDVFNTGTKEDPIGAMEMVVTSSIKTVFKTSIKGQTFYVDGKGDFEDYDKQ